jgi:hypothetical protein
VTTSPESSRPHSRTQLSAYPDLPASAGSPLVLADTSVWELAQKGNSRAETALSDLARVSQLATYAIVAGEVMFGTPPPARNVVAVRARLGELVVLTASP